MTRKMYTRHTLNNSFLLSSSSLPFNLQLTHLLKTRSQLLALCCRVFAPSLFRPQTQTVYNSTHKQFTRKHQIHSGVCACWCMARVLFTVCVFSASVVVVAPSSACLSGSLLRDLSCAGRPLANCFGTALLAYALRHRSRHRKLFGCAKSGKKRRKLWQCGVAI